MGTAAGLAFACSVEADLGNRPIVEATVVASAGFATLLRGGATAVAAFFLALAGYP